MSEPKPISEFVQQCRDLIDRLVASQDSNERAMLKAKLTDLLTRTR